MEPQEFFSGGVRITPFIFLINTSLIIHFFASWYISAKKTGWAIDNWHLSLFFSYFIPFLLMYPFASSVLNGRSVGNHVFQIQSTFNEAYFVSLTGYMSVFLGGSFFKAYRYNTLINKALILPIKNSLGYIFERVVINRTVSWFMFYIYFFSLVLMLAIAFKAGSLNDPRGYFYKNEGIGRALYNLTASLSGVVSLILITRIFQFNKLGDKVYLGLFILFTVFVGSRSTALGPLMAIFINYIYFEWKGKIKVQKLIMFGIVMLTLVSLLSLFRSGQKADTPTTEGPFTGILYGNTFSDLRDFAWVISAWNREPYYGKTYLSAFISFIPSTYSSFRNEYGIGRITARLGGFDPKEHPGLRPGIFGESYLNFGIAGVIVLGILIGYTIRYADDKIRYYAYTNNKIEVFKSGISLIFIGNLSITSGFYAIYVSVTIFLFLYLFKLFIKGFE